MGVQSKNCVPATNEPVSLLNFLQIFICIGLPAGYEFLVILLTTLSESQDVLPVVTFLSYLYSIGGTFLVSLLVNKLLSGKVKTIDMVDALKGVE